jgi:hypothetical protein
VERQVVASAPAGGAEQSAALAGELEWRHQRAQQPDDRDHTEEDRADRVEQVPGAVQRIAWLEERARHERSGDGSRQRGSRDVAAVDLPRAACELCREPCGDRQQARRDH